MATCGSFRLVSSKFADSQGMHIVKVTKPYAARSEPWPTLAACRSADPDLFFPISSSGSSLAQVAQAKAMCGGCPVRRECLAFALRTHQVHGVWGGLSEQERHPLISATLAGVATRASRSSRSPADT